MGPSRLTAGLAGLSRLIIDSECLGTNLLLELFSAFSPQDHCFRYATPVSPRSPPSSYTEAYYIPKNDTLNYLGSRMGVP